LTLRARVLHDAVSIELLDDRFDLAGGEAGCRLVEQP
jgi:hypothetical protein